jgi:hypothetical protein
LVEVVDINNREPWKISLVDVITGITLDIVATVAEAELKRYKNEQDEHKLWNKLFSHHSSTIDLSTIVPLLETNLLLCQSLAGFSFC